MRKCFKGLVVALALALLPTAALAATPAITWLPNGVKPVDHIEETGQFIGSNGGKVILISPTGTMTPVEGEEYDLDSIIFSEDMAAVRLGDATESDGARWGIIFQNTAYQSTTPTPTPSTETPSSWALETVNNAISAGLVPPDLQSRYTQPITRAEFCALATALYEKATGAAITKRTQFNDTTDVNVEKMASLNVVTGTGNGNFSPDNPLTREQAATMLVRLANALGKPMTAQAPSFNDASAISTWAADAVGQVQGAKIMGDVGNGNFNPAGSYTREQSIVTMSRTLDLVTAADGTVTREARLYQLLLEGIRDKKGLDGTSYIDLSALELSNEGES